MNQETQKQAMTMLNLHSHKHILNLRGTEIGIKVQVLITTQIMRDLLTTTITTIISIKIHMEVEQTSKVVTIDKLHKLYKNLSSQFSIKISENIKITLHLSHNTHIISNKTDKQKEAITAKGRKQCKGLKKHQKNIDIFSFLINITAYNTLTKIK